MRPDVAIKILPDARPFVVDEIYSVNQGDNAEDGESNRNWRHRECEINPINSYISDKVTLENDENTS